MFDENLLDSSSARSPVLRPAHWLISLLTGLAGFLGGSLALPVAATPSATKILLLRSAILGGFLMFSALAACYTHSDARRQGFNVWLWLFVVLLTNLPGFLAYLVYSALKTGDWKRATLPIAYTFEVLLVGVAALIPLIYTQALPGSVREVIPVPPPPPGAHAWARAVRPQRQVTAPDILHARIVIPKNIPQISADHEIAPDVGPVVEGVPPGMPGAGDGVFSSIFSPGSVPPPPTPRPKSTPTRSIRVGGQVEAAKAIYTPKPEYPQLARMARIQGTVRLEAVISKDGTIQGLKVLGGHPLLVKAALDAVERWRYQPTLLNSEPVEVVTEIDVNFTLAD